LVAAGYAENQPIASNATEQGKQRNRRIEIALIKEVPAE
jgi:flagellar motor protein MotB